MLHGVSCCRKSHIRMTSSCRNEWISDTRYCPNASEMLKNQCFLGIHCTKDLNTFYLLSTVSNIIGCTSCNLVKVFWQSAFFSSMFSFIQITKFLTMVVWIDEYLTVLLFLKQWPFFMLIYFSLNFWWMWSVVYCWVIDTESDSIFSPFMQRSALLFLYSRCLLLFYF